MVAGADGGLVLVQDRRFDSPRDWAFRFEAPAGDTDLWLRFFYDQCARRGWSSGGIGQIYGQNSGIIFVSQAALTNRSWPLPGTGTSATSEAPPHWARSGPRVQGSGRNRT